MPDSIGWRHPVTAKVTVHSNLPGIAKMGILDVGIPPGFVVDTDMLEREVKQGRLQRFSVAGRQLILYVPEFRHDKPFQIRYQLRARFPVRVSTGAAKAYEYYNPANAGLAAPGSIQVN